MKIIIIGASSGIGYEMALLYAAAGHTVGVTGRRDDLLQQLKKSFPSKIFSSCFDATANNNIAYLQELISELDGLDIFIYNAGLGEPSKELNPGAEIATTRTNVIGFVELVSFTFNFFVEQGHGQIAVTSSVAALRGNS